MSKLLEGGVARDKKLFCFSNLLLLECILWGRGLCVNNRVGVSFKSPTCGMSKMLEGGVARDKKLFLLLQPVASK
ncbi:hypothetical protein LSTR_LSTR011128 [Laodelphax striatellus]|uniref:Uncharacterized protein n=1 Tax=Laodelphax striatellus TaxID=195883 RepID=A0A482X8F9_LAOST|nr:hypothetical protein LSTR_LSTR011128 [Laodelphax striatellus]